MFLNFCKIGFGEVRCGRRILGPWNNYMVTCNVVMFTPLWHHNYHHVHIFLYTSLSLDMCRNVVHMPDSTDEFKKEKTWLSLKEGPSEC